MEFEVGTALPIGVFDSGVGGLTVLRSLQAALPGESFVYLGDTARTPYGSKDPETIRRFSLECAHFLLGKRVKAVIVACNTSSAHALELMATRVPVPVIGTVLPAVEVALAHSTKNRIAVIGTAATIGSGVYERALRGARPEVSVLSVACPLFVPLVEEGMCDGEIVDKVVELYLSPIRAWEADTVVLGCTHYPLIAPAIQRYMGASVRLVACSDAVAASTVEVLDGATTPALSGVSGRVQYYVTDAVERFNRVARQFLGYGVESQKVEL